MVRAKRRQGNSRPFKLTPRVRRSVGVALEAAGQELVRRAIYRPTMEQIIAVARSREKERA